MPRTCDLGVGLNAFDPAGTLAPTVDVVIASRSVQNRITDRQKCLPLALTPPSGK